MVGRMQIKTAPTFDPKHLVFPHFGDEIRLAASHQSTQLYHTSIETIYLKLLS
ncbi:MAG: hypothetical protein S4CHLAM81_01940 [Chlamydiales bacterium]|nr:hypothetical protein [Chlamydiales bacterium]